MSASQELTVADVEVDAGSVAVVDVGVVVTDVDGTDHGGIRWFELRRSAGGPWALFQEGTYAPDAGNRWMASAAMDGVGKVHDRIRNHKNTPIIYFLLNNMSC